MEALDDGFQSAVEQDQTPVRLLARTGYGAGERDLEGSPTDQQHEHQSRARPGELAAEE